MSDARVFIGAELSQFQRSINAAKGQLGGLARSIDPVSNSLGALKGALAGVLSVTAIVAAGRAAIEYGDAVGKAAAKSGIGAKDFQALAYAAKTVDVDMQSLGTSVRAMQVTISEASSGNRSAAATFAALGVSLDELKRLAPAEQFELLADRIAAFRDPADRARAATEAFGKAGADLLPLFERGAAGIRAARDEAERLGVVMTPAQLEALQNADESIKRLDQSYNALARTLTAKVAPALSNFFASVAADLDGDRIGQLRASIEFLESRRASSFTPGYKLAELDQQIAAAQIELNSLTAARDVAAFDAAVAARKNGGAAKPPGFRDGAANGAGGQSAAMTAFLNRSAGSGMSDATGSGRMVMRNGQLVPESLGQSEAMDAQANEIALEAMREMNARKLEIEDEYNSAVVERAQWRESTVMELVRGSEEMQTAFRQAASMTWGELITSGVGMAAAGNSKLAKMQQSLALAQIVWNTGSGIMRAMSDVPWPANLAAAAKVAAMGALQIAQVRSARYSEGGGGAGNVSLGGGNTGGTVADRAGAAPDVAQAEVQQRGQALVVFNGPVFSNNETATWIADQLRTLINDRDVTIIGSNSRQALELTPA